MNEQEFIFEDGDETDQYPIVSKSDVAISDDDPTSEESHEFDFEHSLARLEKIVDGMERGQLSLDQSMKYFEEGTKLSQLCTAKLNETEKKIEILTKNDAGESQWAELSDEQPTEF